MVMTTTFLQLQRQIHNAVGAADYIVNKLKEDIVFFVRVWTPDKTAGVEKEPPVTEGATAYYLRKDCEQWITLWPTNSTYQQGAGTGSGKDPVNAQLPSMLWLPAKLKDRLEIRVATYGEFRKRVRWDNLFGRQVRPDMTSLSRGFYYMSYAVNQGEKDQILSRWFSMKDEYNWDFRRGVWTDGLGRTVHSSTPEERKQFRSMRTENWKMTNDRLIWLISSGVGSILADPNMSVIVSGDAEIVHATGRNPMGEPHPEKGSGELNINLSVW